MIKQRAFSQSTDEHVEYILLEKEVFGGIFSTLGVSEKQQHNYR
jgi:hypothetical protein